MKYRQRLQQGTKQVKASVDQYMVGDYVLVHLTTTISNHHNTVTFKAWANGVAQIARFDSDKRSLDQDVLEYQHRLATKIAADYSVQPSMGQGIVTKEGSPLYAIDTEVHDDHPLMEGSKVILPTHIRYNMAALAGIAIITAWDLRLHDATPDVIHWMDIAKARLAAARVLHHLSDFTTHYIAANSNVIAFSAE